MSNKNIMDELTLNDMAKVSGGNMEDALYYIEMLKEKYGVNTTDEALKKASPEEIRRIRILKSWD